MIVAPLPISSMSPNENSKIIYGLQNTWKGHVEPNAQWASKRSCTQFSSKIKGLLYKLLFQKINMPIASSTEGPVLKKLKKYFISRRPVTGLCGFWLLHGNASKQQSDYCTRIFKAGKGCRNCAPAVFPRPCPPWLLSVPETQKVPHWAKIQNTKRLWFSHLPVSQWYWQTDERDSETAFKNLIKRLKLCITHKCEFLEGIR